MMGMGGMNSKKMAQMMRKMGINQAELEATKVIIELGDKKIVFNDPKVTKVNMMGQDTFQITGEYEEESESVLPTITDEDIETIMTQTSVSREDAIKALEENEGDIAKAIISFDSE